MKDIVRTYFEPYRKSVLFIVILLILQVIFQILIIYSIKPIVAEGINNIDTETIIKYGGIMVALISCYSATTVIVSHKSARFSAESVGRIRDDMFKKVFSIRRQMDAFKNGEAKFTFTARIMEDSDRTKVKKVDTVTYFMKDMGNDDLLAVTLCSESGLA